MNSVIIAILAYFTLTLSVFSMISSFRYGWKEEYRLSRYLEWGCIGWLLVSALFTIAGRL